MATSTIPTILAGQTGYNLAISWIDQNEIEYTDRLRVKAGLTDAEIQTLVTASQAGSNASSWKVTLETCWEGEKNATNATSAVHESVKDKVRYSMKDLSTGAYNQAYMPAPLAVWVTDNNIVDTTQATYIAWKTAVDAVKLAVFSPLNAAFVQYSQRNDSVSP